MRIVYCYDSNGVYIGKDAVFPNPKGSGHLMPPNSTEIAPPDFDVKTQQAIYVIGAWRVDEKSPEDAAQEDQEPQRGRPTLAELSLALTDAQLKIAQQAELIDGLALMVTELQLQGGNA